MRAEGAWRRFVYQSLTPYSLIYATRYQSLPILVGDSRDRPESSRQFGSPAPWSGSTRARGRFSAQFVAQRWRGAGGLVARKRRSCRFRFVLCRTDRARRAPAGWPETGSVWAPCSLRRQGRRGSAQNVQGREIRQGHGLLVLGCRQRVRINAICGSGDDPRD
jgi:hypothetical protein